MPTTNSLSVVVPTYSEAENIRPLTERLFAATKENGIDADLLFVDDESKESEESAKIVEQLRQEGYPVRMHCRKKHEGSGLSSAVLLGFEQAKNEVILCMDADLQHEPESVPAVASPVLNGDAEFTVGSRNVSNGGVGFEWAWHRRVLSHGATLLARPVSSSSDPMSGFFCTTKTVLHRGRDKIQAIGFKIGLEIMARTRAHPVQDVGITFQERIHGESNLTMKQNIQYLQQLASLYMDRYGIVIVVALVLVLYILFRWFAY